MLPRAVWSTNPALDPGGRLAVAKVPSASDRAWAASNLRMTFGSITLSPAATSTSPSKPHPFQYVGPLSGGVPRAERLLLKGVGGSRKTSPDRGHDVLRHRAHDHDVEAGATQVEGLQGPDNRRHARHLETDLVPIAGAHSCPLAPGQNNCRKRPHSCASQVLRGLSISDWQMDPGGIDAG